MKKNILDQIEVFISETGMAPTKFGKLVVNNTDFVHGLRRGKDMTLSTADQVVAFMRDYRKQHGLEAPEDTSKKEEAA